MELGPFANLEVGITENMGAVLITCEMIETEIDPLDSLQF